MTAVNLGFSRPGPAYYSYLQIGHDQLLPCCSPITVLFVFPHWTPQCTVLWIQSRCVQTSSSKSHTRHISMCVKVKVQESRKRPGVAQRVPGGLGSQISWHSAHEGGEVVGLTASAAFTSRKYSWYSFSLGAGSTPGPWYGRFPCMWTWKIIKVPTALLINLTEIFHGYP